MSSAQFYSCVALTLPKLYKSDMDSISNQIIMILILFNYFTPFKKKMKSGSKDKLIGWYFYALFDSVYQIFFYILKLIINLSCLKDSWNSGYSKVETTKTKNEFKKKNRAFGDQEQLNPKFLKTLQSQCTS